MIGPLLTGNRRNPWRVAAWSMAVFVLAISLLPLSVPEVIAAAGTDKLVHVALYGTLMLCFAQAYDRPALRPRIAVALLAYGGLIELLQGLTPTRSASLADLLANAIGISIMLLALSRRPASAGG